MVKELKLLLLSHHTGKLRTLLGERIRTFLGARHVLAVAALLVTVVVASTSMALLTSRATSEAASNQPFEQAVSEARLAGFYELVWDDYLHPYMKAATENETRARPALDGPRLPATITFYACVGNGFCGNAANGQPVFEGAAACSTDLALGTQFVIAGDPSGRAFTCVDRGLLTPTWVDVWFYSTNEGYAWLANVGSYGEIIILS